MFQDTTIVDIDNVVLEENKAAVDNKKVTGGSDAYAAHCSTKANNGDNSFFSRSRSVTLSFNRLSYAVRLKKADDKKILREVSGQVSSGQMMCVLGPSGCGKTSLMHILGKKLLSNKVHDISGAVLCNGVEFTATEAHTISGLVSQEDVFNGCLTVRETLRFAARLKLPRSYNRQQRVEEVISLLQLSDCASTFVGDDSNPYLKGVSGGEKRRLAIGIEILNADISLLILDEPTSGLDAASALNVTNLLRKLAISGITVVATLHQPRPQILKRFQQLMVLTKGRRVFCGSLEDYEPYIENQLQIELPKHESPYDFFLDVLNPMIAEDSGIKPKILEGQEDIAEFLADLFEKSELAKIGYAYQDSDKTKTSSASDLAKQMRSHGTSWFTKFLVILHRTVLIKIRDPIVLMTQISSAIMVGLIFGAIYWDSYGKKQPNIAILDVQMGISMCTMMSIWLPYDVTLTFPVERKIFLRERKSGLYTTSAFFLGRILADVAMHVVSSVILSGIVYLMMQLRGPLGLWLVVNIIGILLGAAIMQLIGAVCRTFEEANLLMMLVMFATMLTSPGFTREVPGWLEWLREISVMGIIADLVFYFEFQDADLRFGTQQEIYEAYAVQIRSDSEVWTGILKLVAIFVFCRILTFCAVKFMFTGRSFAENLRD